MNSNIKTLVFWVVLICVAVLLFTVVRTGQGPKESQITFTQFLNKVDEGQVAEVTITGTEVHGLYQNRTARVPHQYPGELSRICTTCCATRSVETQYQERRAPAAGFRFCLNASPFIVLLGVLDLHDAADAERRKQGAQLRQEPRAPALHAAEEGDVQGRRRRRRGQGRAAGDHRVPARAAEVPEARRPHSQGRAADRTSGNRQDAAGARDRRRSQRAVLLDLRLGLRRNVRRRRREPRPRPVRAGQEERALHHLHRRNRRRRPPSRRRPRRRTR